MNKEDFVKELSVRAASNLMGKEVHLPAPEPARRPYTVTDKETRGKGLKAHQWKKGQSGNPKGRPPNPISLTALLNAKLAAHPELADALIDALVTLGRTRNLSQLQAIKEVWDRVDGKVAETHRIEGELPIRLIFVPAAELLRQQTQISPAPLKELPEGETANV